MKNLIALLLVLGSSSILASSEVCKNDAGNAVLGLVRGLGQEVSLESVVLKSTKKNAETYTVKLAPQRYHSSPETNKKWEITLYDVGDGCMFKSLSLR